MAVTPERLHEIERLFHEARERTPFERAAFLAGACANDSALRREVESLLAQPPAGMIDTPVGALVAGLISPAGALLTGRRIGVFEVQGLLGVGGMGEVYRARDLRLGREVAIKILPRAFKDDPDRLARFEREARTLASLNHPHIGTIYGLEDADDLIALVMELVEGDDLSQSIARGAIPIGEALSIARQIADALEAAHEQGIIHRDLKPANIKVRPDGGVKVLDFGLAKALEPTTSGVEMMNSPTPIPRATMIGTIIGTAAYMAPEQARGKAVDRRADIWAFGVVVYEMLTGRRPFDGDDTSTTLASVLKDDVRWEALPGDLAAPVHRMLRRCLEKDPRRRLSAIGDARIELDDAIAAPVKAAPLLPRRRRSRKALVALAAGIATALVLLIARNRFGAPAEPSSPDARVVRLTDRAGLEESPAISPDGRSMTFTAGVGGRRQIFVQLLAGGAPLQITSDAVDHDSPRWSPDSSSILYFSPAVAGTVQGSIWEIPALGGVPRRIVSSVGGVDVNQTDGRLALFRLVKAGIQLVTAPPDGSRFDVVAEFAPATYYLYPRWSPDGRWIAFQQGDSIRFDVFVAPAAGGNPRQLTHDNDMMSGFAWLPDSTAIVYSSSRGGTMPYLPTLGLWQVTLRDGSIRRISSGEMSYVTPDISKSGAILVGRMKLQTDIWKFPIDGLPAENARRGVRLTRQTGQVLTPTAGPGDKEVAFLSDSGGHANLWVVNTENGGLRQITHERDPNAAVGVPVWSPDGRSIAFVSSRGNLGLTFGVWLVDPDGSDLRVIANPGLGPAWSPDGRWVYYSTRDGAAATAIVLKKVAVDGGAAVTVTSERVRNVIGVDGTTLYYLIDRSLADGTPEFEIRTATPENAPFRVLARIPASRVPIWQIVNPALSPDGKWLAQALTDGFTTNLWALSTATGEWRQITDFGDRATFIVRRVSWSSDGRAILAAVAEGDSDIVMLEGLTKVGRE
jgi:eukaryotic-like serine/threonine-protein kinase